MEYPKSDYKEYPKTLASDDLWGQVRRTIYGVPVPDEQIQMMLDAIRQGLSLRAGDTLLDIGCGNGMLSHFLFDECSAYTGVDFSEYLISIGKKNFERPGFEFIYSDAISYVASEPAPQRFNKGMCFAVLSYLDDAQARTLLYELSRRFTSLSMLFMGNLPDPDRAVNFFPAGKDYSEDIKDHQSQIGLWRNPAELESLAAAAGWRVRVCAMPTEFYQSHYRYNAVLERI